MKVKAKQTNVVDVELFDTEIEKVTRDFLIDSFDLPDCPEIRDGFLYAVWEEDWGHSSSIERKMIREATEDEIAAVQVLTSLCLTSPKRQMTQR